MLDCNKPNIGEQIVMDYLESLGYTVNDVSKDPQGNTDLISISSSVSTPYVV